MALHRDSSWIDDKDGKQGLEWPLLVYPETNLMKRYFLALAQKDLRETQQHLPKAAFSQCQTQLSAWGGVRSRRAALDWLRAVENGIRSVQDNGDAASLQYSWQPWTQHRLIVFIQQMDEACCIAAYPHSHAAHDVKQYQGAHEALRRHAPYLYQRR